MATYSITISASAVDSALTDEVIPLLSSGFDTTTRAAIIAAGPATVRAYSDSACTTQIGLKLVFSSGTAFRFDVAGASLSAVSDTVVYLKTGDGATANVDPYPASAELVAPLIDDFNDLTSNANNGTGNGGITAGGVTGPDGVLAATDFDGTDDFISHAQVVSGTSYTVSAWAYFDAVNLNRVIMSDRDSTPIWYQLDHNNADVRMIVRDNAGNIAVATKAAAIVAGQWYHVAGVRNGGTVSVYVNAGTPATDTDTFGVISGTAARIGDVWDGSARFNGRIAISKIYSSARSAASINLEYLLTGPNAATYITAAEVGGGQSPVPIIYQLMAA
jgi:hypothetical protein